jgi:signal peptidase I
MPATPPPAADNSESADSFWSGAAKQLLPLIVIVVVVKWFLADVYSIPSGSMEPTLHGREYSGDRIFCTKLDYYWRQPRRWEVFVFKFPYEESRKYTSENTASYQGEYFIKRCVGLPGEEIFMARGDLYSRRGNETPKRQVKDDATQRGIWLPVSRQDFLDDINSDDERGAWQLSANLDEAKQTGILKETATFRPQTRLGDLPGVPDRYVRRQFITYQCPRCDREQRATITFPQFAATCANCGKFLRENDVVYYDFRVDYPARDMGRLQTLADIGDPTMSRQTDWHYVPDLRLRTQTIFQGVGGAVELRLTNDLDEAVLSVQMSGAGAGIAKLLINGDEYGAEELPLKSAPSFSDFGGTMTAAEKAQLRAAANEIEFYLCDGEYRAFVNGKPIFNAAPRGHDLTDLPPATASGASFSTITATQADNAPAGASVLEVALDRDIYYFLPSLRRSFAVAERSYMGVGDNCPSSNDSRNWGPVPEKNLVGVARAVWWPLDALRLIH